MPLRRALRRPSHALLLAGALLLGGWLPAGQAQVTTAIRPDGTLGTTVTQSGRVYDITGGTRPGNGPHLFHSFDRFSVGTNDTARFSGPAGIANILSRVTGGQGSSIDGLLQSGIPGANLYLLNPSGVLFGPNARLDVSGSFHVSTADYLRFTDGAKFFATLGQASVLTVAPPAAFGFLGNSPAPITIQGSTLHVPTEKTLSVVGGDLTIRGQGSPITAETIPTLYAPSGRLQLTSVAAPGEVGFRPLELAPDLQEDSVTRWGLIELSRAALVTARTEGSRQAGAVAVRGGQVRLSGRSQLTSNTAGTDSTGAAGRIVVAAPVVSLTEQALIEARARTGSRGNAGEVEVRAGTLTLDGRAGISVEVGSRRDDGSRGAAGRIRITAPTVSLAQESVIAAQTRSSTSGKAGTIELEVGTLTLTEGSQISVENRGPVGGGLLTVTAKEAIVIAEERADSSQLNSRTGGTGPGGRLVVTAPRVSTGHGALIHAGTIGEGPGGIIELRVGTLTMTGGAISTITSPNATGPGGTIELEVGTLTLTDGGRILTRTEGPGQGGLLTVTAKEAIVIAGRHPRELQVSSGLASETIGSGPGGRLVVTAPRVTISGGGTIRALTTRAGPGGTIELRVGTLTLTGGTITTSSTGEGAAGTIRIQASDTFRSHQGRVTAAADRAGGGGIEVRAGRLAALSESGLTTTVQGGEENAGDLTLAAPLIVTGNSTIRANAFGGRGGHIGIATETLLTDLATQVSASSARGIQGSVEVQAPATTLNVVVTPLAPDFAPATVLLRDRCAARLQAGAVSSLVARGRDGVPASPEGVLPSRFDGGRAAVGGPIREPVVARRGGGRPDHQGRLQGRHQRASSDVAPVREPECAAR